MGGLVVGNFVDYSYIFDCLLLLKWWLDYIKIRVYEKIK